MSASVVFSFVFVHNKKLKKQSGRLNVRKYPFTSRVVDIWNSLPEEIIVAKTVKEFEIYWAKLVTGKRSKCIDQCIIP
jgi:hypothetical protein